MYKSNNIILIGFKGAGKTEIGRLLAKEIKFDVIDIDDFIEDIYTKETGKKIKYVELAPKQGYDYFKQIERKAMYRIKRMKHFILCTAGNTPIDPGNRRILAQMGHIVHLEGKKENIFRKITLKGVPVFLDKDRLEESFDEFYKERLIVFKNLAEYSIKADTEENMVKDIKAQLGEIITFF